MTFVLPFASMHDGSKILIDAYGVCQGCKRGVLFTLQWVGSDSIKNPQYPPGYSGSLDKLYKLISSYPQLPSEGAPDHTPEAVASAYSDAMKALKAGLWTPAGVMARKSIDLATKALDADTKKGSPLKGRVDELRNKGLITEALRLMGHVVRLDGNDAAHEEDPFSKDDAEKLCEFAQLFLTLTFTVNGNAAAVAKVKFPDLIKDPV